MSPVTAIGPAAGNEGRAGLPAGGVGWDRPGSREPEGDPAGDAAAGEALLGLEWAGEYAAFPPFGRRRSDPGYGWSYAKPPYGADYQGPPRGMRPGGAHEYGGFASSYEPGPAKPPGGRPAGRGRAPRARKPGGRRTGSPQSGPGPGERW